MKVLLACSLLGDELCGAGGRKSLTGQRKEKDLKVAPSAPSHNYRKCEHWTERSTRARAGAQFGSVEPTNAHSARSCPRAQVSGNAWTRALTARGKYVQGSGQRHLEGGKRASVYPPQRAPDTKDQAAGVSGGWPARSRS